MTTNSNSENAVETVAATTKKEKKVYRAVSVIQAEMATEKNPLRLLELNDEFKKAVKHEMAVEKATEKKALTAEKREQKKAEKKMMNNIISAVEKLLGRDVTEGEDFNLVITSNGTEIFTGSVVVTVKKEQESEDTTEE